jgi:hypothetical protein
MRKHMHMDSTFNIQNSISSVNDLKTTDMKQHTKLCSFDFSGMYANRPKMELLQIIEHVFTKQIKLSDQ